MNILELYEEIKSILKNIDPYTDGEHLWENQQRVTSHLIRLNEIHNELAWLEIQEQSTPEMKKFRTMIVDATIERLDKVSSFESRKLTARAIEWQQEKQ